MRIKRALALALTVCTLLTALPATPAAAAVTSQPFTDIADPSVAQSADLLRLLGIVDGVGGAAYQPDAILTRAQFCKLAVEVMGKGDLVAGQMNRTIFRDVPSTHWARGYVNVASQAQGETPPIIRGDETGRFKPDDAVTYAQAVTILMRILGYSDDVVGFGAAWYDGYLSTAASIGMTDKLLLTPEAPITRGQAALLLDGFLHTPSKGGKEDFLIASLGCSYTDEALLLDVNATAPDGGAGVQTSAGTYKTSHAPFSEALEGSQAKLLLDKDSRVLAVESVTGGTDRLLAVESFTLTHLKTATEELRVPDGVSLWKDGEEKKYSDVWQSLTPGVTVLCHYDNQGKLEYLFLRVSDTTADTTRVLTSTATLSGRIYKNGVAATAADLRPYDVASYDAVNDVTYLSDLRLTGIYENAYPTPTTPTSVTVLGCEFAVADCAFASFKNFAIGDQITLLFSYDGKVAGAVSPDVAKSTTVGVVTGKESGAVTVEPLNTRLVNKEGKLAVLSGSNTSSQIAEGALVTVSSAKKGQITLTRLSGSASNGSLNVTAKTLGGKALSGSVKVYERVGDSKPAAIDYDQITALTVSAAHIPYVHTDYAGKVDLLVLDDVTGDTYQYGFSKFLPGEIYEGAAPNPGELGPHPGDLLSPNALTVKNSANPKGGDGLTVTGTVGQNIAMGLVSDLKGAVEAKVELTRLRDVPAASFDMTARTVTVGGVTYPVSKTVECCNRKADSWFGAGDDALNAARAYAETLTLYYDKDPAQGGKIRLVVVE